MTRENSWQAHRRGVYLTWARDADPDALLEEYALLCDGLRCETVPEFFQKRGIVRDELRQRLRGVDA